MNEMEIRAAIDAVTLERRSFLESVKKGSGDFNEAEAKQKLAEMDKRAAELEKKLAELQAPKTRNVGVMPSQREWIDAAMQKRSLTLGSNGAVNQVKQLFKVIEDKDDLLNVVSFDYGPNASTAIPILEPSIADPEDQSEGASSISEDSTAEYGTTTIYPKAYVSILPITAEALQLGTIDLEAELPAIFQKAFRKVMHSGVVAGTGSDNKMKGLFASAAANTDGVTDIAGTTPTISELAGLAITLAGKEETFELVMHPSVYQGILSDSTDGEDIKEYKRSLITAKEIEGVKVRLDSKAPNTTTAGSVRVVGAPLSRYHVAVGGEVVIDPIKVKGDTKTYFQATAFFGGAQVMDSDVYSLAVASE